MSVMSKRRVRMRRRMYMVIFALCRSKDAILEDWDYDWSCEYGLLDWSDARGWFSSGSICVGFGLCTIGVVKSHSVFSLRYVYSLVCLCGVRGFVHSLTTLRSSHRITTNDLTLISHIHSLDPQRFPALDSVSSHLRNHDSSRTDEYASLPYISLSYSPFSNVPNVIPSHTQPQNPTSHTHAHPPPRKPLKTQLQTPTPSHPRHDLRPPLPPRTPPPPPRTNQQPRPQLSD